MALPAAYDQLSQGHTQQVHVLGSPQVLRLLQCPSVFQPQGHVAQSARPALPGLAAFFPYFRWSSSTTTPFLPKEPEEEKEKNGRGIVKCVTWSLSHLLTSREPQDLKMPQTPCWEEEGRGPLPSLHNSHSLFLFTTLSGQISQIRAQGEGATAVLKFPNLVGDFLLSCPSALTPGSKPLPV